MSKKFTEEQYQKLCNIDFYSLSEDQANEILDILIDGSLKPSREQMNMATALANPLTREWAHDKFVETEKKYYWTNKKGNKVGLYEMDGLIFLKERYWAPLTESEIKAWGYNPEMFDRKELS